MVIGSLPHADGNFDRTNNYTGTIVDGTWDMAMLAQNEFAGDVGYVIPASKGEQTHIVHTCIDLSRTRLQWQYHKRLSNTQKHNDEIALPAVLTYSPLTMATRGSATYCYDIASLQPVYNPLAVYIENNATAYSANPLSTVAVFGSAFGKLALKIYNDSKLHHYHSATHPLPICQLDSSQGAPDLKVLVCLCRSD